ncbi:hypothetical protein CMI45_02645 [Candidatus Pacearchaeota archaeon]|nr:hypothetical protein [Candidatus Pacearchaeota archaeon]|tara:strand:- start:1130 stop:1867 length:738 start_codon:yes stop_codon:yes gene_type:complete
MGSKENFENAEELTKFSKRTLKEKDYSKSSKKAFWHALVFTVVVFGVGLILGFFLEIRESDTIFTRLINSEINILDEELRTRIIEDFEVDCKTAKDSLFNFADKIYEDAQDLEQVDKDGRLKGLSVLHKRYDALRTLLWLESRELSSKCEEEFHVITYLYEYNSDDVDVQGQQVFYSKMLFDLKLEKPDEIVLIPIAVDTGLDSVKLVSEVNNIFKYPVIIVDNDIKIYDIITLDELREMVFETS